MNLIMDSKAEGGLVPVAWLFTWRAPTYVVQSSGDYGTNIKDIDTINALQSDSDFSQSLPKSKL